MFDVEASLQHLKDMRYQVILMKDGKSVEGLPPLERKEKEKDIPVKDRKKQKEINA